MQRAKKLVHRVKDAERGGGRCFVCAHHANNKIRRSWKQRHAPRFILKNSSDRLFNTARLRNLLERVRGKNRQPLSPSHSLHEFLYFADVTGWNFARTLSIRANSLSKHQIRRPRGNFIHSVSTNKFFNVYL